MGCYVSLGKIAERHQEKHKHWQVSALVDEVVRAWRETKWAAWRVASGNLTPALQ